MPTIVPWRADAKRAAASFSQAIAPRTFTSTISRSLAKLYSSGATCGMTPAA
jgi:hypothetical protein